MKKTITILIALCLLILPVSASGSSGTVYDYAVSAAAGQKSLVKLGANENLLALGEDFPAGTSICDWTAIAFSVLGVRDDYKAFLKDTNVFISAHYPAPEGRRAPSATDRQALALTVLALGGDPTRCGRDGSVDLIRIGSYDYDGESLGEQGLNGWIFALIALDAGGYSVPEGARYDRSDILEAIVSAQESDGGFGLIAGSSDIDITAMALQALAPYADDYRAEVDRALGYLAERLEDGALYLYGSEASSESSAQVILALASLGIDPETDPRFSVNGISILDGLLSFRRADGSFAHTPSETEGNLMATEQAMLALASVWKLREGTGRVYDFTAAQKSAGLPLYVIIAGGAVAAAAAVILVRKRGKKHE